jgi:hypothetical protein
MDKYKEALKEVLANLRCVDVTDNDEVDSYVDDSINVIKETLKEGEVVTYREMLKYALIGAKTCMINSRNKGNKPETLQHSNKLNELESTYNKYKKIKH